MVKVSKYEFPDRLMDRIISDIKEKRELMPMDEHYVRNLVLKELNANAKLTGFFIERENKKLEKAADYKTFVKKIRAELRKAYGMFQKKSAANREELFEELKAQLAKTNNVGKTLEVHSEILRTHVSSFERMPFYDVVYGDIWKITGIPRSIIDLGCGLNPFSFPWMNLRNIDYYASELNAEDVKFLNRYFDLMESQGLYGKAIQQNLADIMVNEEIFKSFPQCDVALLFKLLDSIKIAGKSKNFDEKILTKVPAKWLVVSFATKTIGAKVMRVVKRDWLEKLCERHGWEFKRLDYENEIFYVIKK